MKVLCVGRRARLILCCLLMLGAAGLSASVAALAADSDVGGVALGLLCAASGFAGWLWVTRRHA